MRSIRVLTSTTIIGIALLLAQPVNASQCLTAEAISESGIELTYDNGNHFYYKREGDLLFNAATTSPNSGSWLSEPRIALGYHGLLRINWDGTASGGGIIEHTHWPENTMLLPGPNTSFLTTRTSWRINEEGNREEEPIALEPLEFHFGSLTELEHGSCVYDGLLLKTQTMLEVGDPLLLSGIWLTELRLFVINRIFREGHFDITREISKFVAADLE